MRPRGGPGGGVCLLVLIPSPALRGLGPGSPWSWGSFTGAAETLALTRRGVLLEAWVTRMGTLPRPG